MIDILEALEWLNKFDKSHLNGTNQQLLAIAKNRRTADGAVADILRAAVTQAKTAPQDALDYSETLMSCAAVELDRGFKEQARDHIREARKFYQDQRDPHGEAVALWMCGLIELQLPDVDASYLSFTDAVKAIEDLQKTYRHAPDTQDWYNEILRKMNQDIVTIPHEPFTWLAHFSSTQSHISSANRQLVEALNVNIKNKQTSQAFKRIAELKESAATCPDRFESAEIYVETGFAAYRMENPLQAIKDLKYAIIKYPPRSHFSEVTRWMLGAIQWTCEGESMSAKESWQKSLDGFSELAVKADHMNQDEQKSWYEEKIPYMEAALAGKISEYL